MKKIASQFTLLTHKVDARYIQLAILIITLSLLALGVGAPVGGGVGLPSSG